MLSSVLGGAIGVASAVDPAGFAHVKDAVTKGLSVANAASALASGNVLGGAMGLASAVGGPAASIASAVSGLVSPSGLAGLGSAVLGAFGASKAAGAVGSAAAVMGALSTGNIAGA